MQTQTDRSGPDYEGYALPYTGCAAPPSDAYRVPWDRWGEDAIGGPAWVEARLDSYPGLAGTSFEQRTVRRATTAAWELRHNTPAPERGRLHDDAANACLSLECGWALAQVKSYLGLLMAAKKDDYAARDRQS